MIWMIRTPTYRNGGDWQHYYDHRLWRLQDYAYGIEGMSYDDPNFNLARPPFAPYPPSWLPANYVLLNRRFENVGEFGYAYNPASTLPSKTLDFASATSKDRAMLDFFTYNEASPRAGIVNLNTRNGPVLASIISGALLHDPGSENPPPDRPLVSQARRPRRSASHCSRDDEHHCGHGPAVNPSRCCPAGCGSGRSAAYGSRSPSDETKQTIARALAEIGQARTWNLMIDVIAQTGQLRTGDTRPY